MQGRVRDPALGVSWPTTRRACALDRVSAVVLEATDALMGNWFAQFWLGLAGQGREDHLALFDDLNPVDHTARLGSHVLFQWAGEDFFIPAEVRDANAASSPDAQVQLYPRADHQLTDAARIDRLAFLTEELRLAALTVFQSGQELT